MRMGGKLRLPPGGNMTSRSRVAGPFTPTIFPGFESQTQVGGSARRCFIESDIRGQGKAGDVERQSIFWQLAALMRCIDSSASGISQKDPNGSLFFFDFDFSFPRKPSHSHRNQ
jgi:hypothetical protein